MTLLFLLAGLFFFIVGTLGILRFPDALTRAHGAAKCDTLGAALCLAGLAVHAGFSPAALKLLLVVAFLWATTPTATHAIARGIYRANGRAQADEAPLPAAAGEKGAAE